MQDLHNHAVKENTNWREPVAVDDRVALGLYHFAHGNDWAITGANVDLAGPTVFQTTQQFISAVLLVYCDTIHYPQNGQALMNIMKGFASKRQMPDCCAVLLIAHTLWYLRHM